MIRRFSSSQRGAVAITILLVMVVMAVPISYSSSKLAGQFSRGSTVYQNVMESEYSANAGIEYAIWEIIHVPWFAPGLTQENPTANLSITTNGQPVSITVTKIFGAGGGLEGQGIVPTKTVSPTTAPENTLTTFTYTVKLKNEGTDTVILKEITDYLPSRFEYVSGSTTGVTTSNPSINANAGATMCGDKPDRLRWDVESLGIEIASGAEVTHTFQATGTLPAGIYFNQARARYEPWWDNSYIYVYTPYTAPVTVGSSTTKCGFDLSILAYKTVVPDEVEVGVDTEFTYTISIENASSSTRYVCGISDLLPPEFTYVAGSSNDYVANISIDEPDLSWNSTYERWYLEWQEEEDDDPLVTLSPGAALTQVFRSRATPSTGANFNNEFSVLWSDDDDCLSGSHGGTAEGGSVASIVVDAPIGYDILSQAGNKSIKTRVHYYGTAGQMDVLSWQVN